MTAFWDIAPCSIVEVDRRFRASYFLHHRFIDLMMEAVCTSETSVNLYEATRHSIPEGCHIHIRRRENLKSHSQLSIRLTFTGVVCFPE
jgi:hypothetical protein